MLVVISPAKKLDMNLDDRSPVTAPAFAADAETLAGVARDLTHDDLRSLMSISPALAALNAEQENLQDQLHLLRGLRSGTAATNLFRIIDEALVEDELWFRHWDFRRAGVTDATGQAVETGYFLVVPDDGQEQESWQVETHMTITGQSQDHATLSEFVTRLLSRPEIEDVRIRRTELHRYDARNLVDFDLAVVINSKVF